MVESKIPYGYSPDPELQGLRPLAITPLKSLSQHKQIETKETSSPAPAPASAPARVASKPSSPSLFNGADDFPPLGSMNARGRGRR